MFSFWGWSSLYYAALIVVYRFLVYPYLNELLDRQLLGFPDTLAVTATIAVCMFMIVLPPLVWGRRSGNHPVWRGIECFSCFAVLGVIIGAIFAAMADDGWSSLDAVSMGGSVLTRVFSIVLLLAAFIAASWWGSRAGTGPRSREARGNRGERRGGSG